MGDEMEFEYWDYEVKDYVDIEVTGEMFEHAYEEMIQRFRFKEGGEEALQQYVFVNYDAIKCDHTGTPKEMNAYVPYLVSKMLSMYELDTLDFTQTEMDLWWVLWKNTKDIEINGVICLKN